MSVLKQLETNLHFYNKFLIIVNISHYHQDVVNWYLSYSNKKGVSYLKIEN